MDSRTAKLTFPEFVQFGISPKKLPPNSTGGTSAMDVMEDLSQNFHYVTTIEFDSNFLWYGKLRQTGYLTSHL